VTRTLEPPDDAERFETAAPLLAQRRSAVQSSVVVPTERVDAAERDASFSTNAGRELVLGALEARARRRRSVRRNSGSRRLFAARVA
jgi:hypothetical protein